MLHGANPYFTHLVGGDLPPADTPTWMLCIEPLAALTPYTAAWAWFWINVLALLLSLLLLIKEAGFRGSEAIIVAAICLMYPPIASNLWFGQSEIFLCLFLVLMLVALRRGHERTRRLVSGGGSATACVSDRHDRIFVGAAPMAGPYMDCDRRDCRWLANDCLSSVGG